MAHTMSLTIGFMTLMSIPGNSTLTHPLDECALGVCVLSYASMPQL